MCLLKARHRKLQSIKQQLFNSSSSSSTSTGDVNQTSASEGDVDQRRPADNYQLLSKLYQLLVECQNLGDHKVRITNQIIECISSKTRQLGFDSKLNGMFLSRRNVFLFIKFSTSNGLFWPF